MVYEELDKYLLTATWGEELDEYVKDQKLLQISAFYFQTLEKGDCTIFALSVLVGVTINYPSPRDQNKKKTKNRLQIRDLHSLLSLVQLYSQSLILM